jgi:hypothetical protein
MQHVAPNHDPVSRRHVLQILSALGITGVTADALATRAAPTVSPASLRAAAALLGGSFDEGRLTVAEAAVQRNLDQLQVVRELDLPDHLEPAVVFHARRP